MSGATTIITDNSFFAEHTVQICYICGHDRHEHRIGYLQDVPEVITLSTQCQDCISKRLRERVRRGLRRGRLKVYSRVGSYWCPFLY